LSIGGRRVDSSNLLKSRKFRDSAALLRGGPRRPRGLIGRWWIGVACNRPPSRL